MLLANRVNPVRISASISPRHQSRPPGSMASPYGTVTLSPRSSWAPGPRPALPVPAPSPGLYLPAARVLLPGGPGSTARRPGFYCPAARVLSAGGLGSIGRGPGRWRRVGPASHPATFHLTSANETCSKPQNTINFSMIQRNETIMTRIQSHGIELRLPD